MAVLLTAGLLSNAWSGLHGCIADAGASGGRKCLWPLSTGCSFLGLTQQLAHLLTLSLGAQVCSKLQTASADMSIGCPTKQVLKLLVD